MSQTLRRVLAALCLALTLFVAAAEASHFLSHLEERRHIARRHHAAHRARGTHRARRQRRAPGEPRAVDILPGDLAAPVQRGHSPLQHTVAEPRATEPDRSLVGAARAELARAQAALRSTLERARALGAKRRGVARSELKLVRSLRASKTRARKVKEAHVPLAKKLDDVVLAKLDALGARVRRARQLLRAAKHGESRAAESAAAGAKELAARAESLAAAKEALAKREAEVEAARTAEADARSVLRADASAEGVARAHESALNDYVAAAERRVTTQEHDKAQLEQARTALAAVYDHQKARILQVQTEAEKKVKDKAAAVAKAKLKFAKERDALKAEDKKLRELIAEEEAAVKASREAAEKGAAAERERQLKAHHAYDVASTREARIQSKYDSMTKDWAWAGDDRAEDEESLLKAEEERLATEQEK